MISPHSNLALRTTSHCQDSGSRFAAIEPSDQRDKKRPSQERYGHLHPDRVHIRNKQPPYDEQYYLYNDYFTEDRTCISCFHDFIPARIDWCWPYQTSPSTPFLLSRFRNLGVSKSSPRKPDDAITKVVDLIKLQVYNRSAKTTEKSITSSTANSIAVFLESFDESSLLIDSRRKKESMWAIHVITIAPIIIAETLTTSTTLLEIPRNPMKLTTIVTSKQISPR